MRQPEWIKDEPEIVGCLLKVRDEGVWGLRLKPVAIAPLEDVARSICPAEMHHDQARMITHVLDRAIGRIRAEYQQAARILFDMNERKVKSPTERRRLAGQEMHQQLSTFRNKDSGYERRIFLDLANKIQRLAAELNAPSAANPLERFGQLGVLPEDILIARQLLHVARTLDTLSKSVTSGDAEEIGDLLRRYEGWHQNESENGATILGSFDALSWKYLGSSVFELLGHLENSSPGPNVPPHRMLPNLSYPRGSSLQLVDASGLDAFTEEEVTPFFMAAFPVTMMEWQDFLSKFGWDSSHTWRAIFNIPKHADLSDTELGRLPAVAMTYFDAVAYCFWLWLTTPYRFRLPTEAEWNYATTGGRRQRYGWGNEPNHSLMNVSLGSGLGRPVAVDALASSGPFGVVGLSGNTWEYVSTLWRGEQPRKGSDIMLPDLMFPLAMPQWWTADRRTSATSSNFMEDVKIVMKGGSWGLGPQYASADTRIYSSLYNDGEYGGFRLAVSAVRDKHTGVYVPEPSPFIHSGVKQVRNLTVQDMRDLVMDSHLAHIRAYAVMGTTCGGGGGFREDRNPKSWEEIVRARFPHS